MITHISFLKDPFSHTIPTVYGAIGGEGKKDSVGVSVGKAGDISFFLKGDWITVRLDSFIHLHNSWYRL